MSDKPISDLRRRMIADMTIRTFSDKTQRDYIRHIEVFARFVGRSPDTATGDDLRRFQLVNRRAILTPRIASSGNVTLMAPSLLPIRFRLSG